MYRGLRAVIMESTPESTESTSDKDRCPQCDNEYKNLTLHWYRSSECTYQRPTERQFEILEGFLLFRGSVIDNSQTGKHPRIKFRLTNRQLLEWVRKELGVIANEIQTEMVSEDAAQYLAASFPDDSYEGNVNAQTLYNLRTRALPAFSTYMRSWTDSEGKRVVPETVTPTPTKLRIAYGLAGSIQDRNGRDAIHLSITRTDPPIEAINSLFGSFGPAVTHDPESTHLWLHNCEKFFHYIGSEPLPGCEHRWPRTMAFDEPDDVCPACNGRFSCLSTHYATKPNQFCKITPELQREINSRD